MFELSALSKNATEMQLLKGEKKQMKVIDSLKANMEYGSACLCVSRSYFCQLS